MFFAPQGTQATEQSKGGSQGPTVPWHWPFLSGSEAFGLGICMSENSGFIGAVEPAQMLARWRSLGFSGRTGKERGKPEAVSGRVAEQDQRSWDHTVPCALQTHTVVSLFLAPALAMK